MQYNRWGKDPNTDAAFATEVRRHYQPGDVSMSSDQMYNIGFAIHDDFSSSRFHHVSLGLKLGFNNDDAEINALGQ